MRIVGKKSDRVLLFDFADSTVDAEPTPEEKPKPSNRLGRPKGAYRSPEATAKKVQTQAEHLTPLEKRFCQLYVKTSKIAQSVMDAGYNVSNLGVAGNIGTDLLKKPKVRNEIARLQQEGDRESIATAQQVMEFFTRIMNGDEKDQFGLDISAADRLKAAMELAKRTVDLDNKIKLAQQGAGDNTITIKLDWNES